MNGNNNGAGTRLVGLIAAAVAAGACFYAYFKGGEETYAAAFFVAVVCFAVMGAAELLSARKNADGRTGALYYAKPAFLFVLSALTLAAAIFFVLRGQ